MLTVKAYEVFSAQSAVSGAIQELEKSMKGLNGDSPVTIADIKAASEECIRILNDTHLPSSLQQLVSVHHVRPILK